VANVPRVSLFHAYSIMLLDSCLNGTILDAKFHNNLMVVVAILTTLRPCQICRHICITILHHYKHRHILSCILLCSLGIATTHYRSSFNWYIVVVVTIMHKLTPRVMLWLTCTNILWEYVVTNIVVVVDVPESRHLVSSRLYLHENESTVPHRVGNGLTTSFSLVAITIMK